MWNEVEVIGDITELKLSVQFHSRSERLQKNMAEVAGETQGPVRLPTQLVFDSLVRSAWHWKRDINYWKIMNTTPQFIVFKK